MHFVRLALIFVFCFAHVTVASPNQATLDFYDGLNEGSLSLTDLQRLVENGLDPDLALLSVLTSSKDTWVRENWVDFVGLLLAHGASPHQRDCLTNFSPFHIAIYHKNTPLVSLLQRAGADVYDPLPPRDIYNDPLFGWPPLAYAADRGGAAMTRALLNAGANPFSILSGPTLVFLLAQDCETARQLIRAGATIRGALGINALYERQAFIKQLLLADWQAFQANLSSLQKAPISVVTDQVESALVHALTHGHLDQARMLVAALLRVGAQEGVLNAFLEAIRYYAVLENREILYYVVEELLKETDPARISQVEEALEDALLNAVRNYQCEAIKRAEAALILVAAGAPTRQAIRFLEQLLATVPGEIIEDVRANFFPRLTQLAHPCMSTVAAAAMASLTILPLRLKPNH